MRVYRTRLARALLFAAAVAAAAGLVACQGPGAGAPAAATVRVTGHVTAGPVCPVERNPPDPACAPRPVAGGHVTVVDEASGAIVATAATDQNGAYAVDVPPGTYELRAEADPPGIGGTTPVPFVADARNQGMTVDIELDTGIR
jgi:hypothetical protein